MSTDVKTEQKTAEFQQTIGPNGIKLPVYMDNHATTPMDPRVLEEMLPYFMEKFGNAASRNHSFGWAGEEGVETARERVAKLIGATTKEIIFTSGATESDNLAIKGVAEMYKEKGNHIITAVTEHKAVLDTCKRLEKYGYRVTYMAVQKDGLIEIAPRGQRRQRLLTLTLKAEKALAVAVPLWRKAQARFLDSLGGKRWKQFQDELEHAANVAVTLENEDIEAKVSANLAGCEPQKEIP